MTSAKASERTDTPEKAFFEGPAFDDLVNDVVSGRVLAFVGAGFAVPAFGLQWHQLLTALAKPHPELSARVTRLLGEKKTNTEYEAAAQIIQDELGPKRLREHLVPLLSKPTGALSGAMQERLAHLRTIPFEAILTTNFDTLLQGSRATPAVFGELLRRPPGHWWDSQYWESENRGAPVIKLHGDLAESESLLVFSRRDYRERLYKDTSYATFLRSVLATRTVLYLGFSFRDAYLNELRSEVLAMLGHAPRTKPTAYAVMNDVDKDLIDYSRDHEGIHVFSYPSQTGLGHAAFDQFLSALHARTNPIALLGNVVGGKRILWLDRHAENNDRGHEVLMRAAAKAQSPCTIDTPATWEEAMALMDAPGTRPYDLVLTHWGEGQAALRSGASAAVAERFLEELRTSRHRVPALVFAAKRGADARKARALGAGALGYVCDWGELFREIERVFGAVKGGR